MSSKEPIIHSIVLQSDFSAFLKTCDDILSALRSENFGKDELFSVHLALEEAFANAVRHGNKNDPKKQVQVEYSRYRR